MVTNRILLFGGSGQIGKALQKRILPQDWHLFAPSRMECDFMRPGAIGKAVRDVTPDLVINAAAMTGIDACEQAPEKAREINFHAVANIAAQCATFDAPLIQLSTDYVFDGANSRPYLPDDAMNPLNAYGQTKMMGEEAARHGLYWHVILRASLVFSASGDNILTKTLRQIDAQGEAQAVIDQKAGPTSADAVAEALIAIAGAILHGKGNGFGTFHICGKPAATRYEFLQAIMEAYAPYTERRPKLSPVPAAAMPNRVPRPAYSCLDAGKTREIYGVAPRSWREDLAKAVREYAEMREDRGIAS